MTHLFGFGHACNFNSQIYSRVFSQPHQSVSEPLHCGLWVFFFNNEFLYKSGHCNVKVALTLGGGTGGARTSTLKV